MSIESESSSSSNSIIDASVYPEIRRSDIEVGQILGTGSFGAVYSGLWKTGSTTQVVALKKVFVLEKEAEILSKIRHRHIIEFFGICKTEGDFFIVTEYASNGSLYDRLHGPEEENDVNFEQILRWSTEISSALVYLHNDAVTTIIHRDLKSKNVVLDKKEQCKICDFGTSKDLTHSCTAPTWGGTAAWMSPEIINQKDNLTTATDVWSYAVVLWEMLSRQVPYKDFSEYKIYMMITQQGITLIIPSSCPEALARIMRNCWKMNPKERPTMREVHRELTNMDKSSDLKRKCQIFLQDEDWKKEIEDQRKHVENMKKELERKKEQLEAKERALKKRSRLDSVFANAQAPPPEDVTMWNERHTADWMASILSRTLSDTVIGKIKTTIFRLRITGARLLETSQKDLEHLGLNKLGSRLEITRHIRQLKEHHNKFINFPSLEQAQLLQVTAKNEPAAPITVSSDILLLLGIYHRVTLDGGLKFKFFVDTDWNDNETPHPLPSHMAIKSICFSVFDHNSKRIINEPMCYICNGPGTSMDWLQKDENVDRVKVLVNVHYADMVCQPRSTELSIIVSNLSTSNILMEKVIELKLRSSSSRSSASPLPSATSSPQLRGAWQRKANESVHTLTSTDLSTLSLSPSITVPPKTNPSMRCLGGKNKFAWKSQQKRNL